MLIGEVWLCTGQSNMDMRLDKVADPEAEIASGDYSTIRLFKVERAMTDDPQEDVDAAWSLCEPQKAKAITAAGFYMGRTLHQELNVPIGLLHCAYGGTPAEAWVSREALEAEPGLAGIVDEQLEKEKQYARELTAYQQALSGGVSSAKEPASIMDRHNPWVLYNAMLHPLIPYSVRGAVWYQGESNVWHSKQYKLLLETLI